MLFDRSSFGSRSVLVRFSIGSRSVLDRFSIDSRSIFVHPSFILRSFSVRESKIDRRLIEERTENHRRINGDSSEARRRCIETLMGNQGKGDPNKNFIFYHLSNVQKITSAEKLRSRAFDEIVPFRKFIIKDDTSALL